MQINPPMQEPCQPLVKTYSVTRKYQYTCKIHHPDEAEMAQIRAELAAGYSKKDVAKLHNLGTSTFRLNKLLQKDEATQVAQAIPESASPDRSPDVQTGHANCVTCGRAL